MKRIILITLLILGTFSLSAQWYTRGPVYVGKTSAGTVVKSGQIYLYGATSGSALLRVSATAGTGTIFQLPTTNGSNGDVLTTNGSGILSWSAAGAGSMVYPSGSGIPLVVSGTSWGSTITNNSTNWNTAYDDRLKWDGGSTGLTASTGRASLGGTTVGQALFTLANPSAITFIRVNANNTVTALSAADFRTALTLDNVTNESKATIFTNSALTGVPTAPTAANGTNTTQIATTAFVLANGGGGIDLGDVQDEIADSLNAMRNAAISGGTLYHKNTDTIPLFGISGGNGLRGSQPSFLLNADLGGISNVSIKDTMYITSARLFVKQDSGTVTMGLRFYKHATTWPTSASTDLMSGVVTLSAATSGTTTGTVITHSSTPHFDTFQVLPGESVAAIVTVKSNGNMPVLVRGVVYGYTQNRKY